MSRILLLMSFLPVLAFGQSDDWPKVIENPEGRIVIYQPQPEKLQGDRLNVRAAFSVTPSDSEDPIFGALWSESRVATDRERREVTLIETRITDIRFPQEVEKDKTERMKRIIEEEVPKWDLVLSLDDLLATLQENDATTSEKINTEPPEIIVRNTAAVLILLDGEPRWSNLPNSNYQRAVNTPWYLLKSASSPSYFLLAGNAWYTSSDYHSGWKKPVSIPQELAQLQQQIIAEQQKTDSSITALNPDLLPTSDQSLEIIVRTRPAELLAIQGEPDYQSISGTALLYIKNTDNAVFRYIPQQACYVLISGRWFTARSLDGPWRFVPSDSLPGDFARIPEGSDKDEVLAHVAGTQPAREALMDAQVPQTATVNRKEATTEVSYDGDPRFVEIQGTELYYASNSSTAVIKDGNQFYVCDKAVWYVGPSPQGPWTVATTVPKDVRRIPASSPVCHVKYVYIYDYTPDVVYVGYTPGYTGCYVYGPTVVYGTGWYYPGWYGTRYYPRPVTYGFNLHYNPWTGWNYGLSFSYGFGWPGYYGGWWGRPAYYYRPYHGYYGPRGGYYHPSRGYGYRPYYGPRNGSYPNNYYRHSTPGVRPVTPNRPVNPPRPNGNVPRNNVYADPRGNIYRERGNTWQQNRGSNWQRPTPGSNAPTMDLNRQQFDRSRGDQRNMNFNHFNQSRPGGTMSRPSPGMNAPRR